MAIHFKTRTPRRLLRSYKEAIDDGRVLTWSYDDQGDFTHNPDQWRREAWLRPRVVPEEELVFFILSPNDVDLSSETYAVYHGRFVESMLSHFDRLFSECHISAMPEEGDQI